ncbi:unnamed protein product, partial [Oppiella nova]
MSLVSAKQMLCYGHEYASKYLVSVAVDRPLTDITSELRDLEANRLRQLIRATNISLITVSPETVAFVQFYVNQSSTRCRVLELRLSIY